MSDLHFVRGKGSDASVRVDIESMTPYGSFVCDAHEFREYLSDGRIEERHNGKLIHTEELEGPARMRIGESNG